MFYYTGYQENGKAVSKNSFNRRVVCDLLRARGFISLSRFCCRGVACNKTGNKRGAY
jgi:hypothetical protein